MTPKDDSTGRLPDHDMLPRTVRMVFAQTRKSFLTLRLNDTDGKDSWVLLVDMFERFGLGKSDILDVPNGGVLGMLAMIRPKGIRESGVGLLERVINAGADPWVDIRKGKEHWRSGSSGAVALQIIESGDTKAALACLRHPLFPGWQALDPSHIQMLVENADSQQILTLVELGGMRVMANYAPTRPKVQSATMDILDPKALDTWLHLAHREGLFAQVLPGQRAVDIARTMQGSGKREQVMRRHCMEHIQTPGMDEVVAHMAVEAIKRGDRRNYKAWCGVGRVFPLVARKVFDHLEHASVNGLRDTIAMAGNGTLRTEPDDTGVMLRAVILKGVQMAAKGEAMWNEGDVSGRWMLARARAIIDEQGSVALGKAVQKAGPGLERSNTTMHLPASTALLALALMGQAGLPGGLQALSRDADQARARVDDLLGANKDDQVIRLMAFYSEPGIARVIETQFDGILPQQLMVPLFLDQSTKAYLPGMVRLASMQIRCAGKTGRLDDALSDGWSALAGMIDSCGENYPGDIENATQVRHWREHLEQSMLDHVVARPAARKPSGPRF